jgi:PadR family transcriptional regulator PadR
MSKHPLARVELLQGTLDLLILRTLLAGPTHSHAVAKHIQRTSEELLQVETGSLYPALHRLEAKGWIAASWELSDKGKRARYYRLTALGRRQLASEQSKWETFARAMGLVLKPVDLKPLDQEGQ